MLLTGPTSIEWFQIYPMLSEIPRKSMVNTAELRQIFPLHENTFRHVVEGDGRYPRAMTPSEICICDQAALWMVLSVCLSLTPFSQPSSYVNGSVCLSVCHTFSLCSHHGIIMKFSGVITNDRSDVYAKGQGQRSKFKVAEVKTQLSRFRTITPVWFHIWWWNDAQSLVLFRRWVLLIFRVFYKILR